MINTLGDKYLEIALDLGLDIKEKDWYNEFIWIMEKIKKKIKHPFNFYQIPLYLNQIEKN